MSQDVGSCRARDLARGEAAHLVRLEPRLPLALGLGAVALSVLALTAGCGKADPERKRMTRELGRLRHEVAELRRAVEAQRKEGEEAQKWYAEIAPKLAAFRKEAEEFERRAERFVALTRGEATEQTRAMIADVLKELERGRLRRERQRPRESLDDQRIRTVEELTAVAGLSPEQKRQVLGFEREEREEIFDVLMRMGPPRRGGAFLFPAVIEQARRHREEKIRRILDPEQFQRYQMFYRQGFDGPRGGFNRRMQAPERGQDDF